MVKESLTIFLSHAREDSALGTEIRDQLEKRGYHVVFLNCKENPAGTPFVDINSALSTCQIALVLLSPRYLQKPWCEDEISAIWSLRQNGTIRLITIRYELTESELWSKIPLFAGQQIINGKDRAESIVEQVVSATRTGQKDKKRPGLEQGHPVPAILVGCGQWARGRTVLPLFERTKGTLFTIEAVTELEHEEKEFQTLVKPELDRIGSSGTKFYPYLSAALEKCGCSRPMAVIINTPNRFHEAQAHPAILANYDVYCERPINRSGRDLPSLIGTARAGSLYLYSGTQRRMEYPYRYMRYVLENQRDFGRLRSIRCTLASGRRAEGWRTDLTRAGGGIIIDEGYHLLDMAMWLAQACVPAIAAMRRDKVKGTVEFRFNELGKWKGIETSAFGILTIPGGIELNFDLSYSVPKGSICECLELRDDHGARLRLLRDHTSRHPKPGKRPEPGKILHQDGNGKVINEGFVRIDQADFSFDTESSEDLTADDTRPLRQFMTKVRSGNYDTDELLCAGQNDCDARFVVNTQELIGAIYQLADK